MIAAVAHYVLQIGQRCYCYIAHSKCSLFLQRLADLRLTVSQEGSLPRLNLAATLTAALVWCIRRSFTISADLRRAKAQFPFVIRFSAGLIGNDNCEMENDKWKMKDRKPL